MEPYIGEIRIFGGNFAPENWAFCNGQLINIYENEALFSIIGTTYGGDGQNTFALPNLQGRTVMGTSGNYPIGMQTGSFITTLTTANLPAHTHVVTGKMAVTNAAGNIATPANAYWATTDNEYSTQSSAGAYMKSDATSVTLASSGQGKPYDNMKPYLGLSFIIALLGIYPSRS